MNARCRFKAAGSGRKQYMDAWRVAEQQGRQPSKVMFSFQQCHKRRLAWLIPVLVWDPGRCRLGLVVDLVTLTRRSGWPAQLARPVSHDRAGQQWNAGHIGIYAVPLPAGTTQSLPDIAEPRPGDGPGPRNMTI